MDNTFDIKTTDDAKEIVFSLTTKRLSTAANSVNLARKSKQDTLLEWDCRLILSGKNLEVSLKKSMSFDPPRTFSSLHCIPHSLQHLEGAEQKAISDKYLKSLTVLQKHPGRIKSNITVPEEAVLQKGDSQRYAFDLILSNNEIKVALAKATPRAAAASKARLPDETKTLTFDNVAATASADIATSDETQAKADATSQTRNVTPIDVLRLKSFKEDFPEKYREMLAFLSDFGTVNTAFVFTVHNCDRKVALWAHRVILDKYPRFHELYQGRSPGQSSGVAFEIDEPAFIPVEGISLATFCVLLKYLYCDDVDRTVDPSQFLMCDMEHLKPSSSSPSMPHASAVLNEVLRKSNVTQFYASLGSKNNVTWADLFLAADRFNIAKLRQHCLKNILMSVDKDSALEILFGIGTCYKEEIRDPVMKYISDHLDDIITENDQDPFKRFAVHEHYPEVMFELLRLTNEKLPTPVVSPRA